VQPSAFFMVDKVKKIKSHFMKLFFGLRVKSAPAVIWASLIFFFEMEKIVDFILSGNHVASPPSPLFSSEYKLDASERLDPIRSTSFSAD
jgi:hypothetical protein